MKEWMVSEKKKRKKKRKRKKEVTLSYI